MNKSGWNGERQRHSMAAKGVKTTKLENFGMESNTCSKNIPTKNVHMGSIFYDEQELLRAILDLHCQTEIELDPMFNKGMFYKTGNIEKPKYRFDLNPQAEGVKKGDATNLTEISSNSINTMILDPPFLFGIHGKAESNVCSKRYTIIPTYNDMENLYKGILKEANRVLKKGGILIFKCQDYTDNKTTMTHCLVHQWALENGFYAKDLALLVKENKIYNPNTKQRHFRKTHSYFWIFQKKNEVI